MSGTAYDIESFLRILHDNALTNIELSDKNIGDGDVHILCEALVNNDNVTEINLARNKISDVGVSTLAEYLRHNSTLK